MRGTLSKEVGRRVSEIQRLGLTRNTCLEHPDIGAKTSGHLGSVIRTAITDHNHLKRGRTGTRQHSFQTATDDTRFVVGGNDD